MITLKVTALLAVVSEETTALVALRVIRLLVAFINEGVFMLTEMTRVELLIEIPNFVRSPEVAEVSE
jgi:hypothetical protein